jgi:hypothetical protein
LHAASCERLRYSNVAPFSEATFSRSSFVHRLDYLLRQVADQQCQTRIGENMRIQLDFPEAVPRSASQVASIAYDGVTASEFGSAEHDSRLLTLSLRQSERSSSFVGDLSDDNSLAIESYDAGHDSRRNKRKDSYLSASDVASPPQSPSPDVLCPPFKKRKCLSLDVSPLLPVSRVDSPIVSDTKSIPSEPSSVWKNRGSDFNSAHYSSKAVQYPSPSPSHSLSQDEHDFKSLDPLNALSVCESDVSYPPTEISTSPLGLSPVLSPGLRNIPGADIPRIFRSSDDAAEARLMSLLKKEARYYQSEEWLDVFVDPDLALKDNLGPDVIAWILTVSAIFTQSLSHYLPFLGTQVEPPLGSPTASSIRGRTHSHDLHEQLAVHHDSRFLAALLFSLFFFGQARHFEVSDVVHQSDTSNYEAMKGGENKVIWDFAVAAIALSVKV